MKNRKISVKNRVVFWDYDLKKANLKNPRILLWYLNRKLRFGDLSGIEKRDLKKLLSKLQINSSLKELLRNYLAKYA